MKRTGSGGGVKKKPYSVCRASAREESKSCDTAGHPRSHVTPMAATRRKPLRVAVRCLRVIRQPVASRSIREQLETRGS